jgi:4-diphosphocytidyl-2-C-methyl-D-erythritol kinase
MFTLLAPAKINLTLEVLGRRPDGYHEILSVIQTISLSDSLLFQESQQVTVKSTMPEWAPEKSLVLKAVSLLQKTAGTAKGADIEIIKRIPLVSGLGGDSSDAAMTLRGLNQLWGLNLPNSALVKLASELGADVALFLYRGTMLVQGKGDIITPLNPFPHQSVVLLMPDVPRIPEKTRQLYACLNSSHYTDGQITRGLVNLLKSGRYYDPSYLFNVFEHVAFSRFPNLTKYKDAMLRAGAPDVHLTGSGPALFTLLPDKASAMKLQTALSEMRLKSYLTEISSV